MINVKCVVFKNNDLSLNTEHLRLSFGAAGGNRTRTKSLESSCATTTPQPHVNKKYYNNKLKKVYPELVEWVGETGIEPATSPPRRGATLSE